jgi:hypothetical protein
MTGTRKTVTRVDLSGAVYRQVGLSLKESSAFVELVLKEITDCLEKGETVKLSSFGSGTHLYDDHEGAAIDVINAYKYDRKSGRVWDLKPPSTQKRT